MRRAFRTLPPLRGEGREGGLSASATPGVELAEPPPSPTLPPQGGEGEERGVWNGEHRYGSRAGKQAKRLRRELTYTEKLLWSELRKLPLHVRKQSPLGPYIADFLIASAKLVIEVDGPRHDLEEAQLHDALRDAWMQARGFQVLRVADAQVIADPHSLAQYILMLCRSGTLPPLRGEGRVGGGSANATAVEDAPRSCSQLQSTVAFADRPPSPTLPPQGGEGE